MFEKYFNLSHQPFGATPDPRFLLRTGSHREALASLYAGFYANRGFTALIAEPGMGKTTLLFEFLDDIRDKARTVFLFDTLCETADLLLLILQDLGLTPGRSAAERNRQLNELLTAEARADRRIVLVIDEAQNLSLETLEALRLLSNFETSRSKLMQIILCGQPQLADKLAQPEVVQLRQRVSTICRLSRLSASEIKAYVEHRLKLAGYAGAQIFTPKALQLLIEASRGIPRVINTLCFNSLCLCLPRKTRAVDESTMVEAIADLQLPLSSSAAPGIQELQEIPVTSSVPFRAPVLIAKVSKSHSLSSRTGLYLVGALLTLCIALGGICSWRNRNGGHYFRWASAVLSHGLHSVRMSGGKNARSIGPQSEGASSVVTSRNQSPVIGPMRPENEGSHRQVTVTPGQNLQTIARINLGTYDRRTLRQIQALNPHLTNPDHIEVGRPIRLPAWSETDRLTASTRSQP